MFNQDNENIVKVLSDIRIANLTNGKNTHVGVVMDIRAEFAPVIVLSDSSFESVSVEEDDCIVKKAFEEINDIEALNAIETGIGSRFRTYSLERIAGGRNR